MFDARLRPVPFLPMLCAVLSSVAAAGQDGAAVRTTIFGGAEIAYEVIDGLAVYQGDIILGTAEEVAAWSAEPPSASGGPAGGIRHAAPSGYRQDGSLCIWPDGIIPYVIDADVPTPAREGVLDSIRTWDTQTVLRFVERQPHHEHYLRISIGPLAGTWICRDGGPGVQTFVIPPWRQSHLHGIGHVIGLEHEQQRRDRDDWLTVFRDNISATPYARGAWHRSPGMGRDVGPYDYRSVMHYHFMERQKQRNHTRPVMAETIPPGMPFGSTEELSPGDIDSVARLYGHIPAEHVISTNPPGLEIIVDGVRMTAPASLRWRPGSEHTLEVPSPQYSRGSRFLFGRWSDDGPRAHMITATRDTTLYQASFIAQHQVSTRVSVRCRDANATCSTEDAGVTVSPTSPDGYYTLRTPIEVRATLAPGSPVSFQSWNVSTSYYASWLLEEAGYGRSANPASTFAVPDLLIEADFRDGPAFTIESNVDPVPVVLGDWQRLTPMIFDADRFSRPTAVRAVGIESHPGRAYRHRFKRWSNGGAAAHTIEVPQDTDSTLTLTLDTDYRLTTRASADWYGNRVEAAPASQDGFYPEGTQVRLRAVAKPPAKFLGWNGDVSGRDPAALVVMDDGKLAEAVFALDATELREGVPAPVSLHWQGTDLEFHELPSRRYYVRVPSQATELQVRFDTQAATPGAEAGVWVADRDLWPGWVKAHETADLILRDSTASVTIGRPPSRWPVAYFIMIRAPQSDDAEARTLEGTLVATFSRDVNRNRPPQPVGTLEARTLAPGGLELVLDVARAFSDPDGDPLTYAAVSSSTGVAAAAVSGPTVTVTPARPGSATITVTATDDGGLSATQRFAVTVAARAAFTDHPIVPGTTPIRAIHFTELRGRIDAARRRSGLPAFRWTDPALVAGVTPVRRVHLTELRSALDAVYDAAGRPRPAYADGGVDAGATPIKAAHLMELRAAVLRLE